MWILMFLVHGYGSIRRLMTFMGSLSVLWGQIDVRWTLRCAGSRSPDTDSKLYNRTVRTAHCVPGTYTFSRTIFTYMRALGVVRFVRFVRWIRSQNFLSYARRRDLKRPTVQTVHHAYRTIVSEFLIGTIIPTRSGVNFPRLQIRGASP